MFKIIVATSDSEYRPSITNSNTRLKQDWMKLRQKPKTTSLIAEKPASLIAEISTISPYQIANDHVIYEIIKINNMSFDM